MRNNNFAFILRVALRYFRTKRKTSRISSSTLSIAGITVGVMTLTCVLGVMNGFQLSFIEPIINVNSYHIQVQDTVLDAAVLEKIRALDGVLSVVPFTENQAIVKGSRICIVRGIDPETAGTDASFMKSFKDDSFEVPDKASLADADSIVIGSQMAYQLNIRKGETISLLSITGMPLSERRVTGLFKTGYYDIDLGWAFVPIKSMSGTAGIYGIKLSDRFNDILMIERITDIIPDKKALVRSWREFNRNFFSALLMEKIMMMVLVGLIFIVVGFNIFHSLKRSVYEKIEEIATLKALGAAPSSIRNIFVVEGIIIGVTGCALGLILGLFISNNINEFFRLIETIINNLIFAPIEAVVRLFNESFELEPVYIFSSHVFYIDRIESTVFWHEAFFINFFALFCSISASYFASRKVAYIKPVEVLRYE